MIELFHEALAAVVETVPAQRRADLDDAQGRIWAMDLPELQARAEQGAAWLEGRDANPTEEVWFQLARFSLMAIRITGLEILAAAGEERS